MILLDPNVPIYALPTSVSGRGHRSWARQIIAEGVSSIGAGVNAISLAEICVGAEDPEFVFFICAHAEVRGYALATADASRFRTYFPGVPLILL